MNIRSILSSLAACSALSAMAASVHAQIFVADAHNAGNGLGTIGKYTTSGATVNPALVSGLSFPIDIAVSADKLFVTNFGIGTIGEYTTSGATLNPALVSGLNGPTGIAVSGGNLFVSDFLGISEFTTAGAEVHFPLIPGGAPGIAISGDKLFVTNSASTIGEYTTLGATVNPTLISGLHGPVSIAVSGDNLFVVNRFSQTIGKYTTSGETVRATLIAGLHSPLDIAVSGGDLFVTEDFRVGKYDAITGAPIDETFLSGLAFPTGIVVTTPSSVPDASSTWILLLLGLTATFGLNHLLRRPA